MEATPKMQQPGFFFLTLKQRQECSPIDPQIQYCSSLKTAAVKILYSTNFNYIAYSKEWQWLLPLFSPMTTKVGLQISSSLLVSKLLYYKYIVPGSHWYNFGCADHIAAY